MSDNEWVVGFLMDDDAQQVVLIRKTHPAWQAGKLNGVGGKVEPSDTSIFGAMEREFLEEAGLRIPAWQHFLSLTWEEGVVHFFRQFVPLRILEQASTTTDESIERHAAHYAVMPESIVTDPIKVGCPEKVCRTCGKPRERLSENIAETGGKYTDSTKGGGLREPGKGDRGGSGFPAAVTFTRSWSDCGHDDYRQGLVLDPFAGTFTVGAVAVGHGRDALGIDLDVRNRAHAEQRLGMFLEPEGSWRMTQDVPVGDAL